MAVEVDSLMKNQTCELVPQLQGKNDVKCRWIYKTKFTFDSDVECHKACLVAKGSSQ